MPITNGVITRPVSIIDVYKALGLSPQSGKYDVGYACGNAHGAINMWSRMKPVHILRTPFTTNVSKWWLGSSQKCGVTFTAVSGPSLIPEQYTSDKKNSWDYEPPWGRENSPFRLSDFEGYYHEAHPPCGDFVISNPEVGEGGTLNCATMQYVVPEGDMLLKPGSLSFAEIQNGATNLEKWYLGVVVTDSNGKFLGRTTAENPGSGSLVKYPVTALQRNVTYRAYPFLSEGKMIYGDYQQHQCVPLPNTTFQTFKVVTNEQALGLNIFVNATQDNSLAKVTYTIKLTSTSGDITINDGSCYLRFVKNMFEDATEIGEQLIRLNIPSGGLVVSPSKPFELSGIVDSINTKKTYKIQLYLRLPSTQIIRYYFCMQTAVDPDMPVLPWNPDDDFHDIH